MYDVDLDVSRAKSLLRYLELIENRLRAVGKVDLCKELTDEAEALVWTFCIWEYTVEGYKFWYGLCDQLSNGDIYIDRVMGARKAVAKYLKESGYEV